MEIKISIRDIKEIINNITNSISELQIIIPLHILNTFLKLQQQQFNKLFTSIKRQRTNKLNYLYKQQNRILTAEHFNTKDKKSFLNLTDSLIPIEVETILALGPKFAIEPNKTEIPIIDIITDTGFIL